MPQARTLSKDQICTDTTEPLRLEQFKELHQERWGEFHIFNSLEDDYICTGGPNDIRDWQKDADAIISDDTANPWNVSQQENSLKFSTNSGKQHTFIVHVPLTQVRHWPRITGFGFQYYSEGSDHNMWIQHVATEWLLCDGCDKQKIVSDIHGSSDGDLEPNAYHYKRVVWKDDTSRDEYNAQADGYKFSGFVFNLKCKDGVAGSSFSSCTVFNLRLFTDAPDMPDGTRVVLPRMTEVMSWQQPESGFSELLGFGD